MNEEILKAVLYAKKIQNSNKYTLTDRKKEEVEQEIQQYKSHWVSNEYDSSRIAAEIYYNIVLKEKVSKAIIAQCLATILSQKTDKAALKRQLLDDENISYLIQAIKYATGQVE